MTGIIAYNNSQMQLSRISLNCLKLTKETEEIEKIQFMDPTSPNLTAFSILHLQLFQTNFSSNNTPKLQLQKLDHS